MKVKKNEIVEPNSIANARIQVMSKAYLDTLHIALYQIVQADDEPENLDYEFEVKEYKDKFGLAFDKNAYRKLRKQIHDTMKHDSLMTMPLKDGTETDFFPIQEIIYDEENGKIHIVLSRRFKSIVVELLNSKGKKVYYALPDTLKMKSEYAKKMYPILLEYVGKPFPFKGQGTLNGIYFDRVDDIDNFRNMLNIPKSYNITNIKIVCDTICKEINNYTPYLVYTHYNMVSSKGRYKKISHICWNISKKEDMKSSKAEISGQVEFSNTEEFDNIIKNMQSEELELDDYIDIIDAYNLKIGTRSTINIAKKALEMGLTKNYLCQTIELAKSQKSNNLGGKIMSFVVNGFNEPKENKKTGFDSISEHKYSSDFYNQLYDN